MNPSIPQCPRCGASVERDARHCGYCNCPLDWDAVATIQPGEITRTLDGAKDSLGSFKPGRLVQRADGTQINIPARSSYMDMGERQPIVRDGVVRVRAVAVDPDAAFGVVARMQQVGAANMGYSAIVRPGSGTFTFFKFVVTRTESHYAELKAWERCPGLRGTGEEVTMELRFKDSVLQLFVEGALVTTAVDGHFHAGTCGWHVRSLGDNPSQVILRRVEHFTVRS